MSFAALLRPALMLASLSTAGIDALTGQSPTDSTPRQSVRAIRFSLGAGVMVTPRYEGSDERTVRPLPLASLEISNKVFVSAGSVGVYLVRQGGLSGTLGVTITPPRSSSRTDALAGLDKRGIGAFSVSQVSYQSGWVNLGISGTRALGERGGHSLRADAGLSLPMSSRVSVGFAVNLIASDRKNMAYDFGVTRSEAARRAELIARGDDRLRPGEGRAYRPSAGLRSMGIGTTIGFRLGGAWGLVGVAEVSHLGGLAARSPIVRQRTSVSGGLGVTYTP